MAKRARDISDIDSASDGPPSGSSEYDEEAEETSTTSTESSLNADFDEDSHNPAGLPLVPEGRGEVEEMWCT